ncbi:hypothetical protein [Acidovorax sp. PRC11]|uniref:hypothetical protein n=1 Tax=Acidovorax sp. PRC11 TaxID=2962592 RepID=UPI002880CB66|nr:hypothetical protein [Acidovorax sp. PRC11]MDT0136818.1 hypothetical protein [Acidovorax sp. PRC11]
MTLMTITTPATDKGHRAPCAAGQHARYAALLVACCAVLALGGCGTVASRPSNDPATSTQAGESGVTVFGTVDMGVGGVRSSR